MAINILLMEYDSLIVCPPSKYAIVMKDGMQGIYGSCFHVPRKQKKD